MHLDLFLEYDPGAPRYRLQSIATSDIEEFPAPEPESGVIWQMFRRLRKYPISNDQIGIILRKFVMNYSHRQILEDMGYTSHGTLAQRLKSAFAILKSCGFRLESN